MSVHRKYISKVQPTRCNVFSIYFFYKLLYMFQAVPPPIIRNTKLYKKRQVLTNQYFNLTLLVPMCSITNITHPIQLIYSLLQSIHKLHVSAHLDHHQALHMNRFV